MHAEPPTTATVATNPAVSYTDHAMLVVWGEFARQLGLIAGLMGVPVDQKTVTHAPQTKLIQLLVATLAGCAHLQDMADGPFPLVKDRAVAAAWGQPAWADPSGVSRTAQAADAQTIAATLAVLQHVSQPFIDREVLLALRQDGVLTYDADLTGREVSPTSETYPGAAYGWMSDHVGLGYQAAVVSLGSPTYGRLVLTGQRHPGDAVSVSCLQALVLAAEAATGVRPWRRPELVAGRLTTVAAERDAQRQEVERVVVRVEAARVALVAAETAAGQRTAEAERVADERSGRSDPAAHPYGRVAKAQARQDVAIRRVARRRQALQRLETFLAKEQRALAELETAHATVQAHHARLVTENAANAAPVRARFRVDAGFGSGPNLTWLIELGYEVDTKAHNAQVTAGLLAHQPPEAAWERVGKNAELWIQTGVRVGNCPYPVDVAVERFQTGETIRHGTLIHAGSDGTAPDATGWFHRYNGRQTIEAAIKENKGVFQMRHLKLRSEAGLALTEAFALFAANFVRWAAGWLADLDGATPTPFALRNRSVNVKQLVRTAANTSAWITHQPRDGFVVTFTDRSPFAGVELAIGSSGGFQPPLPLLKSVQISPPATICSLVAH